MKRKLLSLVITTALLCSSMSVSAEELGQPVVSEESVGTEEPESTESETVDDTEEKTSSKSGEPEETILSDGIETESDIEESTKTIEQKGNDSESILDPQQLGNQLTEEEDSISLLGITGNTITSGMCGDDVSYVIYDTDNDNYGDYLEISGNGDIYDYPLKFNSYDKITKISINSGITRIGSGSFATLKNLISVNIPDSVTSIGRTAFYGCSSLSQIDLPQNLTGIGESAFYQCSNLKSITIPKGVTVIDDYTFCYCSNLSSVSIPKGIVSIGECAFDECNNLKSMYIPSSVKTIGDYAIGMYYDSVYKIIRDFTIYGESGSAAEQYSTQTGITFSSVETPEGNKTIVESGKCGDNVSYDIYDTDSDELGDYIEIYGSGQMYDYKGTLTSKDDITKVSIGSGVTKVGAGALSFNKNLVEVIIPDSVTSIGACAFQGCTGLKSITIPNGVQRIESSSFSSCTGLESIDIPDSVSFIGGYAFYKCSSLKTVKLPDGIQNIENGVFRQCEKLSEINIPSSVTAIGIFSFGDCTSLSEIIIPDSVTSIGNAAFNRCRSLRSIEVPDNVTSLGQSVFASCVCLEEVKLPKGLTNIENYAFQYCEGLSSISIPDGVTSIGEGAFELCSKLEEVNIPSNVISIGDYAFHSCQKLNNISVPSSVTRIGDYAFNACDGLTIYIDESICDFFCNVTFGGSNWRRASTEIISTVSNEHDFIENVVVEGTSSIQGTVEYSCSKCGEAYKIYYYKNQNECSICGYSIPQGFKLRLPHTIGGCQVTHIVDGTNTNKPNLLELEVPEGIVDIDGSLFYQCYFLRRIDLPGSLTSIGDNSFDQCRSLNSIYIPASVNSIGSNAVGMVLNQNQSAHEVKSDFVIYGVQGSEAENYANRNGIAFSSQGNSGYIVRYHLDGGINNPDNPTSYKSTDNITLLDAAKYGYELEGWYTDPTFKNKITTLSSDISSSVTLYAKWKYLFTLDSYQAVLNDSFDLKYFLAVSDSVKNDSNSYMEFTVGAQKNIVKPSVSVDGYSVYYCVIPAKQLNDIIVARLYVNGKFYDVSKYSAKEYFETFITNKDNSAQYGVLKNLAISILDYGSYCQKYFDYNTSDLANKNISGSRLDSVSDQSIISAITDEVGITNQNSSFEYAGASFTCLSNTCLNIYFKNNDNLTLDQIKSKYKIYIPGVNQTNVSYTLKGGQLEVTLKNIPAAELDNTYSFVIKSSDSFLSVDYCPLIYIKKALSSSSNSQKLKDLCKALYLYNLESNKYFDKYTA